MIDDHPPIIEGYKAILSSENDNYVLEIQTAYTAKTAYEIITSSKTVFDIAFIDLTLPPFLEKKITSGEDLIPLIKKHHPNCKTIILTSHSESILLYKIMKNYNPEGIFVKSDFHADELIEGFNVIVNGGTYYSHTILALQKTWNEKTNLEFDSYNQQILLLLSQGVKTKNLPELYYIFHKVLLTKEKLLLNHYLE